MTIDEKRFKLAQYAFSQIQDQKWSLAQALADYFHDLNAVHELESKLTHEQHLAFRMNLWDITVGLGEDDVWDRHFISATAAQRCEAIGKTLNLW
jgi:hypothetical protein